MLKIKLNHVLIAPFATLITSIVLVLSFLAWQSYQDSTQQVGRKLNKLISPLVQERLTDYLKDARIANLAIKNMVDKSATESGYFNSNINSQPQLRAYITETLTTSESLNTIKIGFPDGSFMGIGKGEDGSLISKVVSVENQRLSYFKLPERIPIDNFTNYNPTKRPWFKNAITSESRWTPVYKIFGSDDLVISLSQSIYNEDGNILGIVSSDLLLEDINKQLGKMLVTNNSFIFIIDSKENVIAQSNVEGDGDSELERKKQLLAETVKFVHEATEQNNNLIGKVDATLPKSEFFDTASITVNDEQKKYFINLMPYVDKEGLDWYIGVVIPDSEFLGDINSIKTNVLVILIITFFSTLLTGLLVTRFINNSIQRLQHNVDGVNSNLSEFNLTYQPIKEIDELSASFMRMSQRLQISYQKLTKNNEQLEQTISLRTKQLESANKKLVYQSTTDQLTQIANKRAFEHQFDEYWHMLQTGELTNLSFLMCDIDFFKPYNDHYGHLEGDKCIHAVAQTMKSTIGEKGMVARFGGEEFVIMIPHAKPKDVCKAFFALKNNLLNKKLPHVKSTVSEYVTLSYGASVVTTVQKITPKGIRYELSIPTQQEVMSAADNALYLAKDQGRNRGIISKQGNS